MSDSVEEESSTGPGLINNRPTIRRNESFRMNAAATAFGSRFSRLQLNSMSKKKLQAHSYMDAISNFTINQAV